MSPWWRSSGCRWRGWSISAANVLERRRGPGLRPERRDHLVLVDGVGRQQLRPGPLLGPELAQPQLPPVLQPHQHPRRPVFRRCPLVEDPQPPRRHQVDQQGQVPKLDHRHLADPPHPGHLPADERSSGGSKVFITFIPGASADSTRLPTKAVFSRRAVISTSGNSGMDQVWRLRPSAGGAVAGVPHRRQGAAHGARAHGGGPRDRTRGPAHR